MKKSTVFYLLLVTLLSGCTSKKQSPDDLPYIDVRKNYPEKEIVLTDIADITYLHLNTQDDDFLYKGYIKYVTENTYLVVDVVTNSILFFSKDGNPISRFNRYGQGPEEYTSLDYQNVIYDEVADDVYVPQTFRKYIQVYSSTGKFKRRLTFPDGFIYNGWCSIVSFNDQSLLVYDSSKQMDKYERFKAGDRSVSPPQLNDSSLFLMSKMDEKILEYVDIPGPSTVIVDERNGIFSMPIFYRITKCADGYLVCHPENDTVYHYKNDKTLTPVLHKIPLISISPNYVLDGCFDAGKYQFMRLSKTSMGEIVAYLMRDKSTGEVYRQKIVLPDYRGKEFFIYAFRYLENEYHFVLPLSELKQANRENRLSGKLKELVDTLNEETDNDVNMFVKFK